MLLRYTEKMCPKCNKSTYHVILGDNRIKACSICGWSEDTNSYVKSSMENKNILFNKRE